MTQKKQTYRDDEIVVIFKHCKSIEELNKCSTLLGYLRILGAQQFRTVHSTLYILRYREIHKSNLEKDV